MASFFPLARSVRPMNEPPGGVEVQALASTGTGSWAETDLEALDKGQATFEEGKDVRGPVPVAAVAAIEPKGKGKEKEKGNNGKEAKDAKSAAKAPQPGTGKVNLLVIADSDMISDRFWARRQKVSASQTLIIPAADNMTFLLNALENMTGGSALSGLRGRSLKERPFTRVEEIRRAAETRFRARERQLRDKLKAAEKRLGSIKARVDEGGRVVISEKDRDLIMQVRGEILQLRGKLREVQHALVRDIENLGFWLKALNIAGVALVLALLALVVAFIRRARARKARKMFREA